MPDRRWEACPESPLLFHDLVNHGIHQRHRVSRGLGDEGDHTLTFEKKPDSPERPDLKETP
jgi:hypothetical protein